MKVKQEEAEIKVLSKEVESLPPPDPRVTMLRTLGEEQADVVILLHLREKAA